MKNLPNSYRQFWQNTLKLEEKMTLHEIDFEKSWWAAIMTEKWKFIGVIIVKIINSLFTQVAPLMLAYFIENLMFWRLAIIILGGRVLLMAFEIFLNYYNSTLLQLNIRQSVAYSANKFFLTVDPIWHSTRESGKIISKVQKASWSFEDILDIICFQITPLIISLFSASVILYRYERTLGITSILFVGFVTTFVLGMELLNHKSLNAQKIEKEDELKQTEVENLQQTKYIRSIFATDMQIEKLKTQNIISMAITGTKWMATDFVFIIITMLYYLGIVIISYQVINLIQSNQITVVTGIALVITFYTSGSWVFQVGNMTKNFTHHYGNIQDLYKHIRQYGKQTFPVTDKIREPIK